MAGDKLEQTVAGRPTIMKPPPDDPSKAPIENILEITQLSVLGPDTFTNAREPSRPVGARGIFGGVVIAQSLAAAQKTVPDNFIVHSCHCYFLLAGSNETPILFYVERVRDGRSFITRTVQARQRGHCIFTTTISFTREGSGGEKQVRHALPIPALAVPPPDDYEDMGRTSSGPYQSAKIQIVNADNDESKVHERKIWEWFRARGKISAEGGHQAHLNALAYMSDSYFIGTVTRIHKLWRFSFKPEDVSSLPEKTRLAVERLNAYEGMDGRLESWVSRPQVGMMVSLDHSIYFHEPRRVRADEWMFTEMESPWAGDGKGVVLQRIYAKDGTLLATCVQEGVVRLRQDGDDDKAKL